MDTTLVSNIRMVLSGAKAPEDFGWGANDVAAWKELIAGDPVAFMTLGVWSRRVKEVDPVTGEDRPAEHPLVPFIPWKAQAEMIYQMVAAVESGQDICVAKSRETGVSVISTAISVWGWLFKKWDVLLCSRTEALVDRSGDPDTLFAKVEHVLKYLPPQWLPCPLQDLQAGGKRRRHCILEHPDGNAITGEATTSHIGRGARKTVVVFDEAASQDRFESGWRSAADTAASRWAVSTHLVGSYFTNTLWETAKSTESPVPILLTYVDDPQKSAGGSWTIDPDGSVTGDPGRSYYWSPWLELQRKRRDVHDLRENVLALPSSQGRGFFPVVDTERQRQHIQKPRRCNVVDGKLVDSPTGHWRIFMEPDENSNLVAFMDPAYGTGSANACIVMMDTNLREVVATYVDPTCPPYDLSREIVMAARSWARGRSDMLIGWEVNGPGSSMHHDFERLRWYNVFHHKRLGQRVETRTKRVGWTSTRVTKRVLFSDLARALADDTVVCPDEEIIDELDSTVVYKDGSLGPARLEVDASSGAREAHGDRVVAFAGAVMLLEDANPDAERPDPDYGLPDFSLGNMLNMDELL